MVTRAFNQPKFSHAVKWISLNDEPNQLNRREIENQTTVLMIADLFGCPPGLVAKCVDQHRNGTYKFGIEE